MSQAFRAHCLLALALLAGYLGEAIIRPSSPVPAFRNFLWGDATGVYYSARSLVEDRDLDLRNQLGNDPQNAADQTAIGASGEWYPVHEPAVYVLVTPFYAVFGTVGLWIAN